MPSVVAPKEHSLTGDACFRRSGMGPRPPTRGEPRSTRVPLSQPFRSLLQSLAERHESELAELHKQNKQLTIENERLSSHVRELRRQTTASGGSRTHPTDVLGDTDIVQLPKRSTRQVGWADQAKNSRGTLRVLAACEDADMEVWQLPGEIKSLPEQGGGPEPKLPKVSDEGEDKEAECEELEQLPDDDEVSAASTDSNDYEIVSALHAKRRIGMMLLSGGNGMLAHAFHAWSTLHGTARFTKRGVWDPNDASVKNAFRNDASDAHFQMMLPRSMSASLKLRETVVPTVPNGLDYTRWVIPPGSNARIVWDLLCMVLLAYDVVMIPISAFNPPQTTFLDVMDLVCMLFWSGDMIMSCLTGFVDKGVAVMQPRRIMMNYLRTWFLLDLLTVGPDWVFEFIGPGGGKGDGSADAKMLRAFRMIRIARLLRLAKLQRVLSMLRDRIDSEIMFVVVNIVKLLLMLLVVNHVLAAAWYSVGAVGMDVGMPNWIENEGFAGLSLGYRYSTSLHWSITQFTPGSMAVQPYNSLERAFAITCLVFGLVIFSSFVSSITAAVTQLKNMSDNKAQQFWLLRRYLRQHGIDRQLFFRILRYADYACRERNDLVTESRLWILQLLSEELRNEVQYQVSFSCLRCLPLFEEMRAHSTACVHQLVNTALGQRSLASRDVLFSLGTPAAYIYVIVSGELYYLHNESCDKTGWELVGNEDWLCEPAFWTNWMHMGQIQAHTETKIVSIEVASFLRVVTQDKKAHKLAAAYSHYYLAWLNRLPSHQLTDVSKGETMRAMAGKILDDARRVRKISELGVVDHA